MATLWPARSLRPSSWRRKQRDDTRAPAGIAIALFVSSLFWSLLIFLLELFKLWKDAPHG